MTEILDHEERVRNQRIGNLKIAMLLPISYVIEKGDSLENYAEFTAKKLAPGWEEVENPLQFIEAVALNMESMGSEIIQKEGNEKSAKLVFGDFVNQELLQFLDLKRYDYDKFNLFFEKIAEFRGLKAKYHREDENLVLEVEV